jgi:hypothetical protein
MRELKQVVLYPNITASGKSIGATIPIVNIFDGTTITLIGQSTSFNPSAPTNGTDTKPCFSWYCPKDEVQLLSVDFVLNEGGATKLNKGVVSVIVDGATISQQNTAGTGLQVFSFDSSVLGQTMSFGSTFSIRVTANAGSFKPFSLTALLGLI